MLDEMDVHVTCRCGDSLRRENLAHLRDADTIGSSGREVEPLMRPHRRTKQLVGKVRLGVTRDGDVGGVFAREASFRGLYGQTRPMLDSIQSFFFHGRD